MREQARNKLNRPLIWKGAVNSCRRLSFTFPPQKLERICRELFLADSLQVRNNSIVIEIGEREEFAPTFLDHSLHLIFLWFLEKEFTYREGGLVRAHSAKLVPIRVDPDGCRQFGPSR